MIIDIRKWINLITEIENNIKYYGNVNKADQKWLEIKGKKSYSGGELQPIIINNKMIGGIHYGMGGIDYIEFKPEFIGKGYLKTIIYDNVDNGKVNFVSASPDLIKKLKNYGTLSYNENNDITTLHVH